MTGEWSTEELDYLSLMHAAALGECRARARDAVLRGQESYAALTARWAFRAGAQLLDLTPNRADADHLIAMLS